jgi:preprotein translocase subunit SecG
MYRIVLGIFLIVLIGYLIYLLLMSSKSNNSQESNSLSSSTYDPASASKVFMMINQ